MSGANSQYRTVVKRRFSYLCVCVCRALAGSLLQYRVENASLASSSRLAGGQATPGSCASAETGDEISLRSLPGGGQQQQRSLSPVCLLSGEEVSLGL